MSDAEREELEKLSINVEKEEAKPNELVASSSKSSESPRARTRNRHRGHKSAAPIKVAIPLDESSTGLPETSQVADPSKPSNNRNVATTSKAGKEDCPFRMNAQLRKPLSNVDKMSIDLPDKSETGAASRPGKNEPPIKEQRPATILSNVDKISPIDLPNESTTEKDKTRNCRETDDEVAME